jgi:hypothetical protein
MRASILLLVSLTILLFADKTWAGQVSISGTHSSAEIKQTCDNVGGTSVSMSNGGYGCVNACGQTTCSVVCNSGGSCTGQCPSCGRRDPPQLPVLSAEGAVTRALEDKGEDKAEDKGR